MKKKPEFDLRDHYKMNLEHYSRTMPFLLHLTERKDKQGTVLAIKERVSAAIQRDDRKNAPEKVVYRLVERGSLAGETQRRVLSIVSKILGEVRSEAGIPLELQKYVSQEGLRLRVKLPLDEEAGAKLSLIFKLLERLYDLDRAELVALRVQRFTREEASYWLTRMTRFDPMANRWAASGMRVMLGGIERKETLRMLEGLKNS